MKTGDIKIIDLVFVNVFLIKTADGYILIDSGFSIQRDMLEKALLEEGALPDKIKLVVITHGDLDHIGNCKLLQEKYHCRIAMHPDDVPMAVEGFRPKRTMKSFRAKFFTLIRKLRKSKFQIDTFTPDILLTEGTSLKEYGWDATVYHLPGHTKGSIGLLTPDGTFFPGDIFSNRKQPKTASYIENATQLKATEKRIKELPVKVLYPGHGKPFEMKDILQKL